MTGPTSLPAYSFDRAFADAPTRARPSDAMADQPDRWPPARGRLTLQTLMCICHLGRINTVVDAH